MELQRLKRGRAEEVGGAAVGGNEGLVLPWGCSSPFPGGKSHPCAAPGGVADASELTGDCGMKKSQEKIKITEKNKNHIWAHSGGLLVIVCAPRGECLGQRLNK